MLTFVACNSPEYVPLNAEYKLQKKTSVGYKPANYCVAVGLIGIIRHLAPLRRTFLTATHVTI